jgi:hypothetical protein
VEISRSIAGRISVDIRAAVAFREHGWRPDSSGIKNSLERPAPKDGVAWLSVDVAPTRKDQIVVLLTAT